MSAIINLSAYMQELYTAILHSPDILGWVPDQDMHTGAISFLQPDGSDAWYATPGWEMSVCPNDMDIGITLEKQEDSGDMMYLEMPFKITGNLEVDLQRYRGAMWEFFANNCTV